MMSAPLFLTILFYAITLWRPSRSVTTVYDVGNHFWMQNKLKMLARELVQDAEMKLKAVQHYRDQYYKSLQYQLGDIVYEMRDGFKRMVRIYQNAERNVSYGNLHHNENIRLYVEVRRLAVTIENKVIMVREWQYRRATAEEHHETMREPLRSGAGRGDDESEELLREGLARGRIARARGERPPPRRAPLARGDGAKRKNNKWQYVRGSEFV